jgi:hypothetical protein
VHSHFNIRGASCNALADLRQNLRCACEKYIDQFDYDRWVTAPKIGQPPCQYPAIRYDGSYFSCAGEVSMGIGALGAARSNALINSSIRTGLLI